MIKPHPTKLHLLVIVVLTGIALIAGTAVTPSVAQPPRGKAAAVKPYKPVPVKLPTAPDDPKLETFRNALAEIARTRVYAKLAPLVETKNFFWDRDFSNAFDKRKPAIDNLANALRLEHENGAGWISLADFAADKSAGALDSRPGVFCTPGQPTFDGVDLDKLIDVTRTDGFDWAYTRAPDIPVRAAPRANAAVVEKLGLYFVRLLGFEGPDSDTPGRTQWAKVAAPSGKTGYVAPNSLLSITTERLCYAKNALGDWRIVGYVGGGD
jgi:hypothetical protein